MQRKLKLLRLSSCSVLREPLIIRLTGKQKGLKIQLNEILFNSNNGILQQMPSQSTSKAVQFNLNCIQFNQIKYNPIKLN